MTLAPHSVQKAAPSSRRAPHLLQNMYPPPSCRGELSAFSKKCGRRRNFLAKKTRPLGFVQAGERARAKKRRRLGAGTGLALKKSDVWASARPDVEFS